MLRAPDGATIEEIMAATGWQSHTVRGAMAGALTDPALRYGALAVLVALGLASYGAAALACGALRPADIRAALRRPPASSG